MRGGGTGQRENGFRCRKQLIKCAFHYSRSQLLAGGRNNETPPLGLPWPLHTVLYGGLHPFPNCDPMSRTESLLCPQPLICKDVYPFSVCVCAATSPKLSMSKDTSLRARLGSFPLHHPLRDPVQVCTAHAISNTQPLFIGLKVSGSQQMTKMEEKCVYGLCGALWEHQTTTVLIVTDS